MGQDSNLRAGYSGAHLRVSSAVPSTTRPPIHEGLYVLTRQSIIALSHNRASTIHSYRVIARKLLTYIP